MDDDIYSFLPNYFLTSPSGMRTLLGTTRMHKGADFGAPTGTPVTAPVAGKVLRKGFDTGGYGNYIIIEEPDGSTRRFSHLASMPTLEQGADVTPGMVIGEVGSTGRSTGSHLDYVMRDPDGGLNIPEVADESLYRAFGQAPRPRLDSTPRPIDPMREVRIGTGELGGADLRKGMSAGPVQFDRLGINYSPSRPSREVNTSEQPQGAKQLASLTRQAEGIVPMDREGLRNVIRSDMMNNFSQYPAGILEEEGVYPGVGGSGGGLLGGGPVAQPNQERSFLDRAIDFASNVGAPLQQLGQGVALLEGDLQSAQALGQMVEGNQKQAQVKARNNATVKLLQDYGLGESQAKNFVESGLAGNFLAEAMKSKKTDTPTKIKTMKFLVDQYGIPPKEALKIVFSGGTNINIGDMNDGPMLTKDEKFMIVQDPNSPSGFVRVPIEETKTKEQIEREVEAEKQQRGKSTIFSSNIQSALDIIAEAEEDPFALPVAGNIAERLSGLPITPQGYIDLREKLATVKSQLAVDTLGNLKKSSPTGASGFGQLSDQERKVIESLQGSLDQSQSKGQLANTLKAIDAFGKYLTYGVKDPVTGEYRNATQEELESIIKGDTSMLDIAGQNRNEQSTQPPASYFRKAFSRELTAEEREEAIQMWNEMSDEQRSQYQ